MTLDRWLELVALLTDFLGGLVLVPSSQAVVDAVPAVVEDRVRPILDARLHVTRTIESHLTPGLLRWTRENAEARA